MKHSTRHHLSRCVAAFALGIAILPAAHAARQFTQVNTTDSQKGNTKMQMTIDGIRFRGEFLENATGMPPVGSYLVSAVKDEMFMVVPSRKVYARFDTEMFRGMAAQGAENAQRNQQQMQQQGMTTTTEDFKLTKELDEAGPEMFGMATRHYRFQMSYKTVMKMTGMPMAMTTKHEETHEFWATLALADDPSFGGPAGGGPSSAIAGLAGMDVTRQAAEVMDPLGFKLKSIVIEKTSGGGMPGMPSMMGGGRRTTTTRTSEIIAFESVEPTADMFTVPADYTETDMLNLFTGRSGTRQMPNLNAPATSREPTRQKNPQKQPKAMPDLNK